MMKYQLHWVFPYYIIQGLNGFADSDKNKIISAEELLEHTIKPVQFRSKIYNWMLTGVPIIQNPEIYDGWPSAEDNYDELEILRLKRDTLLTESDWTQVNDSPLSDTKKAEWATYRQELRDLPSSYQSTTNFDDVVFPTQPD